MLLLKYGTKEERLYIVLFLDICGGLAPESLWISRSVYIYVKGKLLIYKCACFSLYSLSRP